MPCSANELPDLPGVYRLNCGSGFYVGGSQDMRHRAKNHLRTLKQGRHCSVEMQKQFNACGLDSVTFEVLERCRLEQLRRCEQRWISELNPTFNWYRRTGADPLIAWIGIPLCKETKKLLAYVARSEGMTTAEYARRIIESHLSGETGAVGAAGASES